VVAITLEGVTVRYAGRAGGRVAALDGLSLDIASGELLVLAGPSGSGKTTVLRVIAGLEQPVRGAVRIDGRDVSRVAPGERDVALVSQFQSLFPHLTVEQNLRFALDLRNVPENETAQRVTAEARVLGLWSLLRRRPKTLSTGERQRAAIGRATTRRPAIYLFDEPLAGLDPAERDRVRRELQRLQHGLGVTTVYVTHDQRDAMALGDRVAVLDAGRLAQVAEPLMLYRNPRNLFVAQFFGSPPMGIVRGLLRDDGSTAWIDVGGAPLRLLPAQRTAVADSAAGDVLAVGLRTTAVHLGEEPQRWWSRSLDMVVTNIEPMGATTVVALTPSGTRAGTPDRMYATVAPTQQPARGERVRVTVDMRNSHVFDVRTGMRLFSSHSYTE
jgi:multiple sugar transport system ATP-binding protein